MEPHYSAPPKLWLRFFRWYCRPDIAEDIEGDLHERYQLMIERGGRANARRRFAREVLLLCRPGIIRPLFKGRTQNRYAMLTSNLKVAVRSHWRYSRTFLINLLGLSTGLACTLLIALWVRSELAVDEDFPHADRLHQVYIHSHGPSGVYSSQATPEPLADYMREQVPGVEMAVLSSGIWGPLVLDVEEHKVRGYGQLVDPEFFELFGWELLAGDPAKVVSEPGQIVVSESLAHSLYPDLEDPTEAIGRSLTWEAGDGVALEVSGIMKDIGPEYTMQFEFVVSSTYLDQFQPTNTDNWSNTAPRVYARLDEGTSITEVNEVMAGIMEEQNPGDDSWLSLVPYSSLYLHGNFTNGLPGDGRITYVRLFSFVALFVLIIACINFMNLTTARASRRVKEIGVRKTMGASRGSLISQQFTESILLAVLAMLMSLVWVSLFLGEFNQITQKELSLSWDPQLLGVMVLVALGAGVLAGSYPALYLSKFNPVAVLKGKLAQASGDLWARRGLVVFQFVLSIVLLVAVGVVHQQVRFTQDMHLGYNQNNLVRLPLQGNLQTDWPTFIEEAKGVPGIESVSVTSHTLVNHNSSTTGVSWDGKDPEERVPFELHWVEPTIFETMELEFVAGRGFDPTIPTDTAKLVFNEKAIAIMGEEYADPIGKEVIWWGGERREIIGVVKDFHFQSVHEPYSPVVFLNDLENYSYMLVRLSDDQVLTGLESLRQLHAEFNPGYPLEYEFMDEEFESLYHAEQQVGTLSLYFALMAVLISCLGLVGLVAFTADRRRKEIGVRKVLGSDVWRILVLLSGEFTLLVGVALVIALPISYLLAQRWLQNFAFHSSLNGWLFVLLALGMLLLTWAVVGLQSMRTARMNPALALKED